MNTFKYHNVNVRPLSAVYSNDDDVTLKNIDYHTEEGLELNFSNCLSGIEGVSNNKYTNLFLTDQRPIDSMVEIRPEIKKYPYYHTTYFKLSGKDSFWKAKPHSSQDTLSVCVTGTSGNIGYDADITDNPYLFEIEFLSPLHCAVRHYYYEKFIPAGARKGIAAEPPTNLEAVSGTMLYLTVNYSNTAALTFTARSSGNVSDHSELAKDRPNLLKDHQIFTYVLNEGDASISLFNTLCAYDQGGLSEHAPHPLIIENRQHFDEQGGLMLSAVSAIDAFHRPVKTTDGAFFGANFKHTRPFHADANVWTIRKVSPLPSVLKLQTTWNSYVSSIEDNSLQVNPGKSFQNIKNNYLVSVPTNSIGFSAKEIDVNIMPLKNQLTVEGSQSRNNPYGDSEIDVTHRDYQGLHTGTHQEDGLDTIYMSHASSVKEIVFPSDQLTYFHIPHVFNPYRQMNINDSTLVKAGAVEGDTPIKSDKVFKRRQSDNVTIPSDELNGTWLCSWLSGSQYSNSTPIWVDRYYNPSYATKTRALTAGTLEPVIFIDKFSSVTRKLGASALETPVYDKISDLTFEPGALYAYHHVGRGNSQKVIDSLSNKLLISDLDVYKDYLWVEQEPGMSQEEDTHTMPDGTVMTGAQHKSDSVVVPKVYKFNRDNYGYTTNIRHAGSFTLNFWMHVDDWTVPFGHQILGNYTNKGIGIFNEPYVTPFYAIPDENKVHIYNTDYKYIDTHYVTQTIKAFTKRGDLGNYWFVDTNGDIYEYDMKGVIHNKISSGSNWLRNKNVLDIEVDNDFIYVLYEPPNATTSTTATYFYYDIQNQTSGYTGASASVPVWNHIAAARGTYPTYRIHSVTRGPSASTGILVTRQDGLSGALSIKEPQSGTVAIGSGSVIDNNGIPWTIQNNKVWTYDHGLSSGITGLSALSSDMIDGINCDRDGHIWVSHSGNKLSKLNIDRNVAFTTTLTGVLPVSSINYNKYIDFAYEFNEKGYESYCTIFAQSVSGAKAIKVGPQGNVVSTVSMLTGDNTVNAVQFFKTPLVSSYQLSGFSWKTTTGADYLRKHNLNNTQRIEAKLGVTNIYNSTTTSATYSAWTLSYPTSSLTRGWHNICVRFDAEKGTYCMFIDSSPVHVINLSAGTFSYSQLIEQPLMCGASPFYINLTLNEHTEQVRHWLVDGVQLKNIKFYDGALTYYDIKAHYTVVQNTKDLKWDVPTGQRNYIDTIERAFMHKLPGRRSELYNINIKHSDITDPQLRGDLERSILDELQQTSPVYTNVNKVGWDNAYTTSGSAVTGLPGVNVALPSGDPSKPSTTPVSPSNGGSSTGGGY